VRVLTAQQMRDADRRTIEAGTPSIALMERAGQEVVVAIAAAFPGRASRQTVIVAGRGNNGGDGFVVARGLRERGSRVLAVLIGRAPDITPDAAVNLERFVRMGGDVIEAPDESAWQAVLPRVRGADLIVDALAGTGLKPPLSGLMASVVRDLNGAGKPVVAIDLPSGMSADTPELSGDVVRAVLTVTLAAPKIALTQAPATDVAGTVVVVDIGIPRAIIDGLGGPLVETLTADRMRPLTGPRKPDVHKGNFGHVLVVAGSPGKTGAASLAAMGALRSGAGLVTVATPASSAHVVAALGREYMTLALEEGDGLVTQPASARVLAFDADVVAAGPGLGRGPGVIAFVRTLVEQCTRPLVLDADALQALAGADDLLRRRPAPTVLTPHPGEMAALTGRSIADIQANRLDAAREFARRSGAVVVLKGAGTVIAAPNGRAYINTTGNPGMATAGTGDVLTGAVAAWAARVQPLEEAAALAVYLHGAAGDLAAADVGEIGLIAGDLLNHLGPAARNLARLPAPAAS
jgi:hydroxyethylthiazole kinase-like uncharacterized protein yjeF